MSRLFAVTALVAMVGCADDAQDGYVARQRAEIVRDGSPDCPPDLLVTDWPLRYDVSGISEPQRQDVRMAMDAINDAVGFEALAVDVPTGDEWSYGRIDANGYGCDLDPEHAGFSSWQLVIGRAEICVDWKSDSAKSVLIITHELLHTLGLGHDSEPRSVMAQSAVANQLIMPHHIAHIRKLAGLE